MRFVRKGEKCLRHLDRSMWGSLNYTTKCCLQWTLQVTFSSRHAECPFLFLQLGKRKKKKKEVSFSFSAFSFHFSFLVVQDLNSLNITKLVSVGALVATTKLLIQVLTIVITCFPYQQVLPKMLCSILTVIPKDWLAINMLLLCCWFHFSFKVKHWMAINMLFSMLSRVRLFFDPVGSSQRGSSAHGILQTRILAWVAISIPTQGLNPCLLPWEASSLPLSHQAINIDKILFFFFHIGTKCTSLFLQMEGNLMPVRIWRQKPINHSYLNFLKLPR